MTPYEYVRNVTEIGISRLTPEHEYQKLEILSSRL